MTVESKVVSDTPAYGQRAALVRVPRRTREARFLNDVRDRLTAHVGGRLDDVQDILVDQIGWTLLRLETLNGETIQEGACTPEQNTEYCQLVDTVTALLGRLTPNQAIELRTSRLVSATGVAA